MTTQEILPPPSDIEDKLGANFWVQPETALLPDFQPIYTQCLQVLRDAVRSRNGDVLDYMLVERLAMSYAILRQREADADNQITDRTRREMNKDWLEFTMALKKIWNGEDKNNQTELILEKINRAVLAAVKDMPAEQSRQVQLALAESFESHGL